MSNWVTSMYFLFSWLNSSRRPVRRLGHLKMLFWRRTKSTWWALTIVSCNFTKTVQRKWHSFKWPLPSSHKVFSERNEQSLRVDWSFKHVILLQHPLYLLSFLLIAQWKQMLFTFINQSFSEGVFVVWVINSNGPAQLYVIITCVRKHVIVLNIKIEIPYKIGPSTLLCVVGYRLGRGCRPSDTDHSRSIVSTNAVLLRFQVQDVLICM